MQFWLRWMVLHCTEASDPSCTRMCELQLKCATGMGMSPPKREGLPQHNIPHNPGAQLHPPHLTATLRYTWTEQLRQEKLHFISYAEHNSNLRKGIKTSYWLDLDLDQTFGKLYDINILYKPTHLKEVRGDGNSKPAGRQAPGLSLLTAADQYSARTVWWQSRRKAVI